VTVASHGPLWLHDEGQLAVFSHHSHHTDAAAVAAAAAAATVSDGDTCLSVSPTSDALDARSAYFHRRAIIPPGTAAQTQIYLAVSSKRIMCCIYKHTLCVISRLFEVTVRYLLRR